MGDFMAHHDRDFIVGQVELRDQTRVEHDPSARHAESIEFLARDDIDLPRPGGSIGAEHLRLRFDPRSDCAHPSGHFGVGIQLTFRSRLIAQLV